MLCASFVVQRCVNKLCVSKWCVRKWCVGKWCVCVEHLNRCKTSDHSLNSRGTRHP